MQGTQDNCERKKCEQPRDENKEHDLVVFSGVLDENPFFCVGTS
jgi:hypothetical protein